MAPFSHFTDGVKTDDSLCFDGGRFAVPYKLLTSGKFQWIQDENQVYNLSQQKL